MKPVNTEKIILAVLRTFFGVSSTLMPKKSAQLAIELLFRPRRGKRSANEQLFWSTGCPVTFKSGCRGRVFGSGERKMAVVHGWQSRGSHFRDLIEALVSDDTQVIVWDGPAHGDSPGNRTHLPEFSKTLESDLLAINSHYSLLIGHSFGAAAVSYICSRGFPVDKICLISAPNSALGVFQRFWNTIGLHSKACKYFLELVEAETQTRVKDMNAIDFVERLPQEIVLIHDETDTLIPFTDSVEMHSKVPSINLFITNQYGHHKIYRNKEIISLIARECTKGI